ncbi:DUF4378 domain-containing protein [Cephalotus follicularis]|uniref:DUF4378 domain-containing protein n=1 Tax=Cephalotus follicularis TaxID=3775 RepID=A0A1Q3CAF5_CEPFO|nr:DUF4378 domain-containing protein [Cephalotus follicularis]
MLTKMESKQSPHSVIAKLMGLDDLPPQQPAQKRKRVLSENYFRRVNSIGVLEKRSFCECSLSRFSNEEKKDLKHIFEVAESLKRGKVKADSSPSDANMAYGNHDALVVVESKEDLSVKHIQETNSLVAKHLRNLQGVPTQPRSSSIRVLKSISASDNQKIDICKKLGRRRNQRNAKLLQKVENGVIIDSCEEYGLGNFHNFSTSQLEPNVELRCPHMNIVVLQPNHGNSENAPRWFSSSSSHEASHSGKHKEFVLPEIGNTYCKVKKRLNLANEMEPVGLISPSSPENFEWQKKAKSSFHHLDGLYEARDGKKEKWKTTKKFLEVGQAGRGRNPGLMLAMPDHESRPRILDFKHGEHGFNNRTCPNDVDANCPTPLGIISARVWKEEGFRHLPTCKSVPGYFASTRSHKIRTNYVVPYSDRYMGPAQHMSRKQVSNKKDSSELGNPGSRCIKSQSIFSFKSKNNNPVEMDVAIEYDLNRKFDKKRRSERNSMVCKSSSCGFDSNLENSYTKNENSVLANENSVLAKEKKNNIKERDLYEQKSVFPMASDSPPTASMVSEGVADLETGVASRYSGNYKDQQSERTDFILLVNDDDASQIPDDLTQQDISIGISEEGSVVSFRSGTDSESLMNLDETNHPSPVSVLEPLFNEEISSGSERFCSVSHQRLKLIKSDSPEAYSEGTGNNVSSYEQSKERSEGNLEEYEDMMRLFKVKETKSFSYIVDVLHEAGLHNRNQYVAFNMWQSPDCVNPSVFEKLEKKYGEQTSWKRSERRLLFDRINLGLTEILQPCIGKPAWAKPVSARLSSRQSLEEELWMLLVSLEKEVSKCLSHQKVLAIDDRWLELGDDIEVIGREIESSLINELAAEIISIESS